MRGLFQKPAFKNSLWPAVFVLVLATVLLFPSFSFAQGDFSSANFGGGPSGAMLSILANLLLGIINFLGGTLLLPLINLVAKILSYNEFLKSNAVTVGWPLVRDLCNMFFVVILLVIAFSTILNIANYSYKNTLFKLILAAILINFSKTILGFLIDFGQIIMLTFVNAFKDALAVNLVYAFGLTEILKIQTPAGGEAIQLSEVFVSLLLGIVLLIVAIGTMLAYVAVLLYRIIALWVLVILSPLAFLLSAVPGGAKYASEFWSNFWKQLTTGVILGFFLWLSLTILAAGFGTSGATVASEVGAGSDSGVTAGQRANVPGGTTGATAVSSWERMYTFIVAIALLLLALNYAQQAGGFAGAFAGKISGKLSQLGSGALKLGYKGLQNLRNAGINKFFEKTGIDLNVKRVWGEFQSARQEKIKKQLLSGKTKAGEAARGGSYVHSVLASATGGVADHYDTYGYWKGLGRLARPGLMGKEARERHIKRIQEAEEREKLGRAYADLATGGGKTDQYLSHGQGEIEKEKKSLNEEKKIIEERKGFANLEQPGDEERLIEIDQALGRLKNEEIHLNAHLRVASFEIDGLNNEQLQKFYDDQIKEINDERQENDRTIIELYQNPSRTPEENAKILELENRQMSLGGNLYELSRFKSMGREERVSNIQEIRDKTSGFAEDRRQKKLAVVETRLAALKEHGSKILTVSESQEREELLSRLNGELKMMDSDLINPKVSPEVKVKLRVKRDELDKQIKELSRKEDGSYLATSKQLGDAKRQEGVVEENAKEMADLGAKRESLRQQGVKGGHFSAVEKEEFSKLAAQEEAKNQELRKQAAKISPVVGFEAQQARRALEAEEMKKVQGTQSDTELITMFREAQARGNKARMAAVLRKLADDYNDNEILNSYGYNSDAQGFRDFFENEVRGKKGGYSEQEMLALANDIAYINESRNHYNTARMATMKNGLWRWYTEQEHVFASLAEISKKSPRDVANKLNRLSYGGETPDGKFMLTGLGAGILRQQAIAWPNNERLITEHLNPSAVEKFLEAEKREGAVTKALNGLKYIDKAGKEGILAGKILEMLKSKVGTTVESASEIAQRVVKPNFGYDEYKTVAESLPFNRSEINPTASKIIENITNNITQPVEVRLSQSIQQLRGFTGPAHAGFLDPEGDRFWAVRKLLNKLNSNLNEVALSQGRNFEEFGRLGERIKMLDAVLPTSRPTTAKELARVSATMEKLKTSEAEINEIINAFRDIK